MVVEPLAVPAAEGSPLTSLRDQTTWTLGVASLVTSIAVMMIVGWLPVVGLQGRLADPHDRLELDLL